MVPDRAVVLYRVCHHVAVANSLGLAALGVTARIPDPPGGRIGRDDRGEPTGWLYDNALRPIAELERLRFAGRTDRALRLLSDLRARGLTTLGAMSATAEENVAGHDAAQSGRLPVGLRLYVTPATLDGFGGRVPPGDDRCLVAGVKVLLDGSLGARTAELSEAYSDSPDDRGLATLTDEGLAQEAERVRTLGLALAVHAIGDRAVTRAVDLLASDRPVPPIRIEHASVVRPTDVARLASTRPSVVVQPDFVTSDPWIVERLGETRAAWTYPFRELFDRGVPLAGSSDAPIESADPWSGLATLIGRCGFTPDEAIQLYTAGGARALQDPRRGHLEAGAVGDLVVVDAPDPFRAIAVGGPVRAVFVGGVEAAPEGAI
jgi:predicted amidohydrolase YtcJ